MTYFAAARLFEGRRLVPAVLLAFAASLALLPILATPAEGATAGAVAVLGTHTTAPLSAANKPLGVAFDSNNTRMLVALAVGPNGGKVAAISNATGAFGTQVVSEIPMTN